MSLTTVHLRDALAAEGVLFVRITRRREYHDMLPPVPWVIRNNNGLLSLAAIIVISAIACLLAS
jgi:hypothetical protein